MRKPDLSGRLSPPPLSLITDPSHVDAVVAWLQDPRLRGDPMTWIPIGHLLLATVGTPQMWHGPGQNPLRRSIEAWSTLAIHYLRTTASARLSADLTGSQLDGVERLALGRLATTLLTALATGHIAPARLRSLQRSLAPFREHLSGPEAPADPTHRLHGSLRTAWPLAVFATPPAQWPEEVVRLYQHYGRTADSPQEQQAIDRFTGLLLTRGWSRTAYRDALVSRATAAASGTPTPSASTAPRVAFPARGGGEGERKPEPEPVPLAEQLTQAVPLLDLVLTATPSQWPRTLPSAVWRPLLLSADPAIRELAIRGMGARSDSRTRLAPSPVPTAAPVPDLDEPASAHHASADTTPLASPISAPVAPSQRPRLRRQSR